MKRGSTRKAVRGAACERRSGTVTALVAVSAFLVFGLNSTETAALPAYVLELGGGPFLAGLQNSVFVLLAIALRLPLERFVERKGSRAAMVLGAVGYTVPCLLLAGCSELWHVVAVRSLQAFGLAAFQPSIAQYLAAVSPPAVLGRRLGIVRFATTASLMTGPAALFPLIAAQGYGAFFAALAVAGTVGGAVALALPTDRCDGGTADTFPVRQPASLDASAPERQRRRACLLIAGPFLLACGYSVIMNFGQVLSRQVLTSLNDGMLFTCLSIGGLAGSLLAGWASDTLGAKRAVGCCIAANGAGLALMAIGEMATVLAGSLLCGAGYFGATAAFIAAAGSTRRTSRAGTFLSRQQSSLDMGMVVGGMAAGALLQAGLPLSAPFFAAAAVAGACLLAWGMMYPTEGCD